MIPRLRPTLVCAQVINNYSEKIRGQRLTSLIGLTLAVALSFASATAAWADSQKATPTSSSMVRMQSGYGHLPLSFEANHGQWDPSVQFVARGSGHQLFLRPSDAVLALRTGAAKREEQGSDINPGQRLSSPSPISHSMVRMRFDGANLRAEMVGLEKLPGIVNYILGEDPTKWRTHIPTYQKVEYQDIYSGIDLVYYGNQGRLEYDFIVAPGADPKQITLAFEGVEVIDVDQQGDLVLTVLQSTDTVAGGAATLRMHKPVVYQQDAHGHKHLLAGSYVLLAAESSSHRSSAAFTHSSETAHVGFQVASYDASQPLIIDPVLSWATYLGGNSGDEGHGIAVDQLGQSYVTGGTSSPNFPTTSGAFQTTTNGDAFVTKLNAAGTALVYSTYLGGSGGEGGWGIAVDGVGNAYVTGITNTHGSGFPGTAGSLIQSTFGGGTLNNNSDAFVAKLNATGTALVYSTYLGGSGGDAGFAIAVDHAGQAYVTGRTNSPESGFPGTSTSLIQSTFGGTRINDGIVGNDAFVAKLNAAGTDLIYATYLGGEGEDFGFGIAVDQTGQAHVTGYTSSPGSSFPGTAGSPIQSTFGGALDAFVTKLNATGTALIYSTYLGGIGNDQGRGIAVDQEGSAYVTGRTETSGSGFPGTAGSLIQNTCDCDLPDAFVTKLNASGTTIAYSTYIGGSLRDAGTGIAVDGVGQAYVIGDTTTPVSGFPGTAGNLIPSPSDISLNIFVTKLNATGTALIFSAYLGGNGTDVSTGIAVDGASDVYITGDSDSLNFPGTVGSRIQNAFAGGFQDGFVAKITSNLPFAAFRPQAEIDWRQRRSDTFQVRASFTLSPSSNGIHPLTEAVTVQVGSFATTIPAGSFKLKKGRYVFEGVINGVTLEAVLRSMILGNDYEFTVEGKGVEFSKTEDVVTVGLTIGDDSGSQTITAIIK